MLVALLAITNLVQLGFMLSRGQHRRMGGMEKREEEMKSFLQKDIGFTTAQMQAYDASHSSHKQHMKQFFDDMRSSREENLKILGTQNFTDSAIEAVSSKAGEQQEMLEIKMLHHLQQIRNICTPEQRIKFDTSVHKIFTRRFKNKSDKN